MTFEQYIFCCLALQGISFLLLVYAVIFNAWGFSEIDAVGLSMRISLIIIFPIWFYVLLGLLFVASPFIAILLISIGIKQAQKFNKRGFET